MCTASVTNAATRGAELQAGLQVLKEKHEMVGDARSVGLMGCLELVSDRAAKMPAGKEAANTVYETAYEAGVIVRISGNNLIISPPLVITSSDVERIIKAVDVGLAAAA